MKIKSARLFFIPSFFSLLLAFYYRIFWPNTAIDIQLHDNYIVFAVFHFWIFLSLVFFLNGSIYSLYEKLSNKHLNRILGLIHWMLLTTGFLLLILSINIPNVSIVDYYKTRYHINWAILLILLAHLFIPVNLLFTQLKKHS